MRAIQVARFGEPAVLTVVERPDPTPAADEVLVAVGAATVNPTDLSVRSGEVRTRMPDIALPVVPGWDVAGTVVAVGSDVGDRCAIGDRVVAMVPWRQTLGHPGAYASMVCCHPDWLAHVSGDVDDAHASTLPLNGLTAAQALELADLEPGARILVTGANGAVGAFAVQLAAAAGHEVIATADTSDQWVHTLGAARVVERTAFDEVGTVDACIDAVPVGAAVLPAVRDGGIVVATRFPADDRPGRDIEVRTVLVRTDPEGLADLAARLGQGQLRTRVDRVVGFDDAATAHTLLEAGGLRGKIVLSPHRG